MQLQKYYKLNFSNSLFISHALKTKNTKMRMLFLPILNTKKYTKNNNALSSRSQHKIHTPIKMRNFNVKLLRRTDRAIAHAIHHETNHVLLKFTCI